MWDGSVVAIRIAPAGGGAMTAVDGVPAGAGGGPRGARDYKRKGFFSFPPCPPPGVPPAQSQGFRAGRLMSAGGDIELPGASAHQVRDVLRRAVGETLTLLDGSGGEWPATLTEVSRARVRARVGARRENAAEPSARVVLYQGMLQGG